MAQGALLLSRHDVQSAIELSTICDTVIETLREHGLGRVVLPPKITLDINPVGHKAWMNAMPAYVPFLGGAGIKWAGGFVDNPRLYGLPYIMGIIILNDPVTGRLLAVMDGVHITNARTGAAGAVSAKYAARPESSTVAMIGAGVQARWVVRALRLFFKLQEVRVVDIRPDVARRFADEMQIETGLHITHSDLPDQAAEGADIICMATTADAALVHNDSISPGATVVAIGSYQELDDAFVLAADKVIVDNMAQCQHRGELARLFERGAIGERNISAELGEVVACRKPGRESAKERILVVPIGLGSLDIAIARKTLDQALQKGCGRRFDFADGVD